MLEESVDSVWSPISIPRNVPPRISRSPYKVAMAVPLIAKTVAEMPMASSKVLQQDHEPFPKPYCYTETIIQGVRTEAQKLILGDAEENVGYVFFVKEDPKKAGHNVQLVL